MTTSDFTTSIIVDNTAAAVFNAINNVNKWWQGEIKGNIQKLHDAFEYRMKDVHFSKQKIVELVPNERVVWLVTESMLDFTENKTEWTGTKIIFEISELNGKTQVRFSHLGLTPKLQCYQGCSNGWEKLIQQSLFNLITSGKGIDVFP